MGINLGVRTLQWDQSMTTIKDKRDVRQCEHNFLPHKSKVWHKELRSEWRSHTHTHTHTHAHTILPAVVDINRTFIFIWLQWMHPFSLPLLWLHLNNALRHWHDSLNAQGKWTSESKRFFFPRVSVKSAEIEIGGKRYQILGVQSSINGIADPELHANFAMRYVCTGLHKMRVPRKL